MDGFSYNNIFETKGLEYLIIIAFLALIIPFWIMINSKRKVTVEITRAIGILSAGILKIPHGIFYGINHTWAHLEKSGFARVGLDDLILHITGELEFIYIKGPKEIVRKGDVLAEVEKKGKTLKIYSPLSGEIQGTNPLVMKRPGIMNDDPYGKGWIFEIKPTNWKVETTSCYFADEATAWIRKELFRFRDFIAESMQKYTTEPSLLILQDGGELCDQPLSEMPDAVWNDFQESFLGMNY